MKYFILGFLAFFMLIVMSCEKKKYCIYGRMDLRSVYVLAHPTKQKIMFELDYDYSNPKNVFWTNESKLRLDSLIRLEGYSIDTALSEGGFGERQKINGGCQVEICNYNKTIYEFNYCEEHEE
jgi:hypothetical protein